MFEPPKPEAGDKMVIFFFFCVGLLEPKWAEVNCLADLDWESRWRYIHNWLFEGEGGVTVVQ